MVVGDKPRDAAAFLAARFLTRPEARDIFLQDFIEKTNTSLVQVNQAISSAELHSRIGVLIALAYIFKIGDRSTIQSQARQVLQTLKTCNLETSKHEIVVKLTVKLIQRLGLTFLKPKIAPWRYQRGTRSLLDGLKAASVKVDTISDIVACEDLEEDIVDPEIEDIIDFLLTTLSNNYTTVRWSSAKGIGRICDRLPKSYTEQIISSILDLFILKENDSAWHGGCLSLAELARRGLVLPDMLSNVLSFIEKALIYDELKGKFGFIS